MGTHVTRQNISEAFNSMLRTDYISLNDTEKLELLAQYYVDHLGYLRQVLHTSDHLIVGRRGTGKTTLLYRALVECMRSWLPDNGQCLTQPRTLGIYIDLSKCASLSEDTGDTFPDFEHTFISDVCRAVATELMRSWPELAEDVGLVRRIFAPNESSQVQGVREALQKVAATISTGVPRLAKSIVHKERVEAVSASSSGFAATASLTGTQLGASAKMNGEVTSKRAASTELQCEIGYTLTARDLLNVLGELRAKASLSSIILFIDEFSSLPDPVQRRFTTLLKKLLGNQVGIFIKLGAITDNYTLGSAIILQRDLFEISLDLDAFIERSGTVPAAMAALRVHARNIVQERLAAYGAGSPDDVFVDAETAWTELSRAAMGVSRTMGIILQQAHDRATSSKISKIRKTDVEYGINYASQAYLRQLTGASKGGVAIPSYIPSILEGIIKRALSEAAKGSSPASHFMIAPEHEHKLRHLSMFFMVHLLTRGRSTRKENRGRSLFCLDYGQCIEHKLGFHDWETDSFRQQRFAYDDVVAAFSRHFGEEHEAEFLCPTCKTSYRDSELYVAGKRLRFCPDDRSELIATSDSREQSDYTEEEIKIIGAMRAAQPKDRLVARRVADDVGCYVQKVAKFGERLERGGLVVRDRPSEVGKFIYFDNEGRK